MPPSLGTLLVIEDELEMREILFDELIGSGWNVIGEVTLDRIENQLMACDGVIMDWIIPGLDTLRLYNYCRQRRPCIVISGDPECPVPGFLVKPFPLRELQYHCIKAVDRRKSGKDLYVGDRVESTFTPEWGAGEVLDILDENYWIQFPDKTSPTPGKATRILKAHLRKV